MAWPSDFRERLRAGTSPIGLVLDVLKPLNDEGVGIDGWFACSDPALGGFGAVLLDPPPRLGSSGVTPQSWAYQEGAWSLTLHIPDETVVFPGGISGGPLLQYAARALRRGALVRLSIGELGTAREDYQPLKLGRLQSVRSTAPGLLEVTVWDLNTALRSRLTATGNLAEDRVELFYSSVQFDTVGSTAYTVGDGVLEITGGVTDRFLFEDSMEGAVLVTGNSTTFWLTFTGTATSPDRLTGVSAAGQFGTTASDASSGNQIQAQVLLEGHPLNILRSILTSTGTAGANGGRDLYPRPWGLGLPEALLDVEAWRTARLALTLANGTLPWRLIEGAEQPDPASWIAERFNPGGIWIAVREGQIVPCYARDPNQRLRYDGSVVEADIERSTPPFVEWYPQEVPLAYHTSIVQSSGGSTTDTSNISTLPCDEEIAHDLSSSIIRVTNEGGVRSKISEGLAPWDHFMPEYLTVRLVGIRSYAPGDVLLVTLPSIAGRLDGTRQGYNERPCMVVRESMDLATNTTTLTLAALPTELSEDSG